MFRGYLEPVLGRAGMAGVYANKAATATPLGCAVFYRRDRLRLAHRHSTAAAPP